MHIILLPFLFLFFYPKNFRLPHYPFNPPIVRFCTKDLLKMRKSVTAGIAENKNGGKIDGRAGIGTARLEEVQTARQGWDSSPYTPAWWNNRSISDKSDDKIYDDDGHRHGQIDFHQKYPTPEPRPCGPPRHRSWTYSTR